MSLKAGFQIAPNWPEIGKNTMVSQFVDMTSSSIFFDWCLFLLPVLVTGLSFMSISSLVLKVIFSETEYKGVLKY